MELCEGEFCKKELCSLCEISMLAKLPQDLVNHIHGFLGEVDDTNISNAYICNAYTHSLHFFPILIKAGYPCPCHCSHML